jgi:hypothetical protein
MAFILGWGWPFSVSIALIVVALWSIPLISFPSFFISWCQRLIFFLVPWWAEVHIFVGFVMFYWILTPVLYYTNVRSRLFFSQWISSSLLVLGSRLLPHLRKRTFWPFWASLQRLSCTASRRQIRWSCVFRLFPALPSSYLCHNLFIAIRSEHMCDCAYRLVSWKKFDKWDEED